MAKRAREAFIVALKPRGKRIFQKDEIVPPEFAKGRASLVYDDTERQEKKGPHVRVGQAAPEPEPVPTDESVQPIPTV